MFVDQENIPPAGNRRQRAPKRGILSKASVVAHQANQQKRKFERAIAAYSGSDPLAPWLSYVRWAQSLGNQEELFNVLSRCTQTFRGYEQYKNNHDYMKVWVALANLSGRQERESIFLQLSQDGTGAGLSLFYQAWALVLENNGKISDAGRVYQKGLQVQAQPLQRLQASYAKFCEKHPREVTAFQHRLKPQPQHKVPVRPQRSSQYEVAYDPKTVNDNGEEISFEEYRLKVRQHMRSRAPVRQPNPMYSDNTPQRLREETPEATPRTPDPYSGLPTSDLPMSSPTMNTKAALQDVIAMFANSPSSQLDPKDNSVSNFEVFEAKSPKPFEVFADDDGTSMELGASVFQDEDSERETKVSLPPILETSHEHSIDSSVGYATRAFNPFDKTWRSGQIKAKGTLSAPGVVSLNGDKPFDIQSVVLGEETEVELGDRFFHVDGTRSSYKGAQRLIAQDLDAEDDANVCIDFVTPPDLWAFYMSQQVQSAQSRLPQQTEESFALTSEVFVYGQCSCSLSPRTEHGSLLDVLNVYKKRDTKMSETLVCFYGIEMLRILSQLRAAGTIHAGICPEAFLVRAGNAQTWSPWTAEKKGDWKVRGLSLGSFGHAYEVRAVPAGAVIQLPGVREAPSVKDVALPSFSHHPEVLNTDAGFLIDAYGVCNVMMYMLSGSVLQVFRSDNKLVPSGASPFWSEVFSYILHHGHKGLREARAMLEQRLESKQEAKKLKVGLCKQNIMMYEED